MVYDPLGQGGLGGGLTSGLATILQVEHALRSREEDKRRKALFERQENQYNLGMEGLDVLKRRGAMDPRTFVTPGSQAETESWYAGQALPDLRTGYGGPALEELRKEGLVSRTPETMTEVGLSPAQQLAVGAMFPHAQDTLGLKTPAQQQAKAERDAITREMQGILEKGVSSDPKEFSSTLMRFGGLYTKLDPKGGADYMGHLIQNMPKLLSNAKGSSDIYNTYLSSKMAYREAGQGAMSEALAYRDTEAIYGDKFPEQMKVFRESITRAKEPIYGPSASTEKPVHFASGSIVQDTEAPGDPKRGIPKGYRQVGAAPGRPLPDSSTPEGVFLEWSRPGGKLEGKTREDLTGAQVAAINAESEKRIVARPGEKATVVGLARGDVGTLVRIWTNPNETPERRAEAGQALEQHAAVRGKFTKEQLLARHDPDVVDLVVEHRKKVATALAPIYASQAGQATTARLNAQLAKDEEGNAVITKIEEAKQAGRPLNEQAQKEVKEWGDVLRVLNTVQTEYTVDDIKRYVGYVNREATMLQALVKEDPRFMRFLALNEQLRASAFYRGGKQLTPFEAAVVFGFTPDGRERLPGYWQEKAKALRDLANYQVNSAIQMGKSARYLLTPEAMASGKILDEKVAPMAPEGWRPFTIPSGDTGGGGAKSTGRPAPSREKTPAYPQASAGEKARAIEGLKALSAEKKAAIIQKLQQDKAGEPVTYRDKIIGTREEILQMLGAGE